MFLADTHMHSTVSFDGESSRSEMALAAREAGLNAVCFTDHYDIINEKSEYCPFFDWETAKKEHHAALVHQKSGFDILYGLELGNAPADFQAAERSLLEPGLDCVIGSIHNTSKALGGVDYYYVNYAKEPELAALHLTDYFDSMLRLVQWGGFDTLGHIPYPLRYMRDRDGQPLELNRWREVLDDILRLVAEKGRAIEVNTNRARTPLDDYAPILRRFRELGGEFVTCGADAHQAADVGKGIPDAYRLLSDCGFRYVTVFRGRRPEPVKL